jgi:hypothetical protein
LQAEILILRHQLNVLPKSPDRMSFSKWRSLHQTCSSNGYSRRPISARSPSQNGHAERLIGTIRRDCLDHVIVFGERHLRYLLTSYQQYYNEARPHLAFEQGRPSLAPSRLTVELLPSQFWADCTTDIAGFEFPSERSNSLYFAEFCFSTSARNLNMNAAAQLSASASP